MFAAMVYHAMLTCFVHLGFMALNVLISIKKVKPNIFIYITLTIITVWQVAVQNIESYSTVNQAFW